MSEMQQLRSEFRADLRDLKSDLNLAVARIEHSLEHTETTIMQRMTQQENRIMSNLNPIAEWRIEAEKRLAEHTQATRIISAIFGFVGAAFFSLALKTMGCSSDPSTVANAGSGSGSGSGAVAEASGSGSGAVAEASGSGSGESAGSGSGSGSGE